MNITAFEFTACQTSQRSPVILSEFAGAATCFSGAIIVNPWHEKKVAAALFEALTMPDDLKEIRQHYNFSYVKNHTAAYWISMCIRPISASRQSTDHQAEPIPLQQVKDAYDNVCAAVLTGDHIFACEII